MHVKQKSIISVYHKYDVLNPLKKVQQKPRHDYERIYKSKLGLQKFTTNQVTILFLLKNKHS
jgi:hypothetical protein